MNPSSLLSMLDPFLGKRRRRKTEDEGCRNERDVSHVQPSSPECRILHPNSPSRFGALCVRST